jgi:hypothetical protein
MHGMMDLQVLKQRHEERLCTAQMYRLAKALRATRKQQDGSWKLNSRRLLREKVGT